MTSTEAIVLNINGMAQSPSSNPPAKNIILNNYTAFWAKNSEQPTLKDITTNFPANKLTAVIGKIGSGKTTMLMGLLNEIPKYEGRVEISGKIAYVEQEPIVF